MKTFTMPSFQVNGSSYGIVSASDSFQIRISRYSKGTIDGTFSGLVSNATNVHHVITQGKIRNVKVN